MNTNNEVWEQDVLAALTEWINRGLASFSWDQFSPKLIEGKKAGLVSVIEKARSLARAKDPAFDKTAAIYKLAGAADKFERK